jgi:hypothetical protein
LTSYSFCGIIEYLRRFAMAKIRRSRKCGFCGAKIEEGSLYIYPIPRCEAFPEGGHNFEGAYACKDCRERATALQIEQGMLDPNPVKPRLTELAFA